MENIRRVNPLSAGNVNQTAPVARPGGTEPMVPVQSDGIELHGVSASPIEARPVFVPRSLAQALASVPSLGIHVAASASGPAGLGIAQAGAPKMALTPTTVPPPSFDAEAQATRAIADVVRGTRPGLASVKVAFFQSIRQRQPNLSPDAVHAANQFVEGARTPEEMGARLLGLVKLYSEQPGLTSAHLHAIQQYTDSAGSPEEATVRLWGLANMFKGAPDVGPDKIHALATSLSELPLGIRNNALDHVVRAHAVSGGRLSADGISPFLSTVYSAEGDPTTNRDAAYHIAATAAHSFG